MNQIKTLVSKFFSLNVNSDILTIYERIFISGTLFLFVFDFNSSLQPSPTTFRACWPHFPQCENLLHLPLPPDYSYGFLQAVVFLIVLLTFGSVIRNKKKSALFFLLALTIYKTAFTFLWSFNTLHNFEYFHLLPTWAFLLSANYRIFNAQVMWAFCYFFSGFVKINEGWITGSYFSSLVNGLPLVPELGIPIFSNSVFFAETICGFLLLVPQARRWALTYWTIFHLYSVIMVGFFYPARCFVMLWILFFVSPLQRGVLSKMLDIKVVVLIGLMTFLQTLPLHFNENPQMTLRTEGYGFSMIDANFQCRFWINQVTSSVQTLKYYESRSARGRCAPRRLLEIVKPFCKDPGSNNIQLILDQSLNGSPFRRIINEPNACGLKFEFWKENSWINERGPIVGYPSRNGINDLRTNLPLVNTSVMIQKNKFEAILSEHVEILQRLYLILWFSSLGFCLFVYIRSLFFGKSHLGSK